MLVFRLIGSNPEVAMDSIVHITQHMTPAQRADVGRVLTSLDTQPTTATAGTAAGTAGSSTTSASNLQSNSTVSANNE